MLSVTNSRSDVQLVLVKGFAFFGFADQATYDAHIDRLLNEVEILKMRPVVGETEYEDIQAKDKVGLTKDFEELVYWAEVYYTAAATVAVQAGQENLAQSGDGVTLSAEGYTKTVRGGSAAESTGISSILFGKKARNFLAQAGFRVMSLRRGGGFWERERDFFDAVLRSHFAS